MSSDNEAEAQPEARPSGSISTNQRDPDVKRERFHSFRTTVGWFTAINLLQYVLAFATSPILARVLGPAGRGDLAAISVVTTAAPWVSELGVTAFLMREGARQETSDGELMGSAGPIGVALACVIAAVAIPIAHAFGQGRPIVEQLIEVGLWLLPISVVLGFIAAMGAAKNRWDLVLASKLISTLGTALGIVGLAIAGRLTVETGGIVYIASGIVSALVWLPSLRNSLPWRFSVRVARNGFLFGSKSWLSTIAAQGNSQLDQLLMAGLVPARVLGWYSLAVTISTVSSVLIGPVSTVITPKAAAGDTSIAITSCRITVLAVAVSGVGIGIGSWFLLPPVFGHAFAPAIPMVFILLLGSVAFVPAVVLNAALSGAGDASTGLYSQVAGLAITLPALLLLLPGLGGIGAAIASVLGYAGASAVALRRAQVRFSVPLRQLVVPTREDVELLLLAAESVVVRVTALVTRPGSV